MMLAAKAIGIGALLNLLRLAKLVATIPAPDSIFT
jgi:hypothetical protein